MGCRRVEVDTWDLVSNERTGAELPASSIEQDAPPPPTPPEATTRRMYIKKTDIEKFVVTLGCPGCASIAKQSTPVAHNDKRR